MDGPHGLMATGYTILTFEVVDDSRVVIPIPMNCDYFCISNLGPGTVWYWPQRNDVKVKIPNGQVEEILTPFSPRDGRQHRFLLKEDLGEVSLADGESASLVVRFLL